MAAFTLLLLVGTQILNWYWPALLFVVSFAYGAYRLRGRIPGLYRLAQAIDDRLGLHDALSTAFHFSSQKPTGPIEYQLRLAERTVAGVELSRAVPTPLPRSSYVLGALVMVSVSLFAARYLIMRSIDLGAPIAAIHLPSFDEPQPEAENRKSAIQERFEEQLKQMGLQLDPVDDHPGDNGLPENVASGVPATPDSRAPVSEQENSTAQGNEQGDREGAAPEGNQNAKNGDGSQGDGDISSLPGLNVNGKKSAQSAQNTNGAGRNGQSSSMLDKMRDAMANLMAKLKMPSGSGQQQQSSDNASTPGSGQQAQNQGQRNGQGQNQSNGQGQQGNPNGEQATDSTAQAQAAASGRSGERGQDQPGGKDSKSGMGKQDGDKSIENAEQLAAMGKISEIIGKRSAQIQGEMTVEVPSGRQQLRTAYTKRQAGHADAGGELTREEIPLMLQPYVQRYFDEIRKVPPAARSGEQPKTRT